MQDTVNLHDRGTYALIFDNAFPLALDVGSSGYIILPAGVLIYVGSALGPGGLAARVGRHLRPLKAIHWHVDRLTSVLPVSAVWVDVSGKRLECQWAEALRRSPGVAIPVAGFGASDCRCPAHLFACDPERLGDLHHALGLPYLMKTGAH